MTADGLNDNTYIDYITGTVDSLRSFKHRGYSLCLYGAGDAGRLIYRLYKECGITPDLFLDNSDEKSGKAIIEDAYCYKPGDIEHKENCIVVLCINWRSYKGLYYRALRDGFTHFTEFSYLIDDVLGQHTEYLRGFMKYLSEYGIDVDIIFPSCINRTPQMLSSAEPVNTNHRIAVYAASFGNYDEVYLPRFVTTNIDYYYISDEKPKDLGAYRWINARELIPNDISIPILRNRYAKMHPKTILPDYDYTIYVDSNLEIIDDLSVFIRNSRTGISVHTHYNRDCLYYEAMQVVNYKRIVWKDAYDQIMRYLNDGFPLHFGLGEMPVIAIDHTKPSADVIMNAWWEEFNRGALRDQLSFMYVLWKLGFTADDIASIGTEYRESDRFIHHLHKAQSEMVSRIL